MNSATSSDQVVKIVVAFLDGRRLKGSSFNFSALKDSFDVVPEENRLQRRGIKVEMKDVKAVFFVKEFSGNPDYRESPSKEAFGQGRSLEVTFVDGEKIVGSTQGYNPQRLGFFLAPLDPSDNNSRIFVVNRNTRNIKPLAIV